MKTTAKQFAEYLHESSLPAQQKQYVLELLPNLSAKQIEQIAKILKKDVKRKRQIIRKSEIQEERVIQQMEHDLIKEIRKIEVKESGKEE